MSQETTLTSDETTVITSISRSFARRMSWNPEWEFEDVFQELCLYWLKRKKSGWKKPHEDDWKGAMGRCLLCHLKDIQRRECVRKLKTNGPLSSLEALMEEGFDIPILERPSFLFDFEELLNAKERLIYDLLIQGKSKKEVAQKIGKSRVFVHQRLKVVRRLAE